MKNLIIKRIRPTLRDAKLYNNGRQSSMKKVYTNQEAMPIPMKPVEMVPHKEELIENKKNKEQDTVMMDTKEKVELAAAIMANETTAVKAKRIKKDKGLIERKENPIIVTEDNRELLND